jgi:hypothetical protein
MFVWALLEVVMLKKEMLFEEHVLNEVSVETCVWELL